MIQSVYPKPYVNPFNTHSYVKKTAQEIQPRELSLPRFLNYVADLGGCAHYRILWAEQVLNASGKAVSHSNTSIIADAAWYTGTSVVQIQRQATNEHYEFVKFLRSIKDQIGFKLIYNIDDVPFREHIPDYNSFKFAFDNDQIRSNIINMMNLCDEVVTTCSYMRDLFREVVGKQEITVIPNYPPYFWIGHLYDKEKRYKNIETYKRKPRILYPGSGAHFDINNKTGGKDDFEELNKFIIDTREKYTWVFLGSAPPMLAPYIKSGQIELHEWAQLIDYPFMLQKLDPTIIIAPLQDNSFNKAKSDIKFVESAILGVPCLLQNIETYNTAPDAIKFNNVDDFKEKLDKMLRNKQWYYSLVTDLRAYGVTRFLERPENIGCFYELYTTPYNSPERKYLKPFNS